MMMIIAIILMSMNMMIVEGISPLLQGRNGYLPSIGWKDRFLDGNA